MLQYRMSRKPRRWGWVVAILVIGFLIILLSSRGARETSASLPAVTENGAGAALLQFWSNLKAGAMSLWADLTGQSQPRLLEIDLVGDSGKGSGDEEENPADANDIQILATSQPTAQVVLSGASPQILIYHSHSYESYEKQTGQVYTETAQWRTKNNGYNIAAVGEALASALTSKYGISTLHDETDNECLQLGSSYSRSLATVKKDMAQNPGLKMIIDLHRDAFNAGINPSAVTINGKQVARIMIVIGTGTGQTGVGFTERPDWQKNKALADAITNRLNQFDAQLARKVDVKTGRYNQHVSTGAILIEVGHNKNTLEEALNAMPYLAQAIADVFNTMNNTGTATPAASATPSPSAAATPASTPPPTAAPTPISTTPALKVITLN